VSSDAAPAASFSPLFGKTLRHQLLTYPASAQTTIWCKKRAKHLHDPVLPCIEMLRQPFRTPHYWLVAGIQTAYQNAKSGEENCALSFRPVEFALIKNRSLLNSRLL
jgi:hypothetical protein